MIRGVKVNTISENDLNNATSWVDTCVDNPLIQTILSECLAQSKRILFNTQISLEDGDCALVFRAWGNEIYMSHCEDSDAKRLKLAVAVRSLASKKDEPKLWDYLSTFEEESNFERLLETLKTTPVEPPVPKFEVILGGKK